MVYGAKEIASMSVRVSLYCCGCCRGLHELAASRHLLALCRQVLDESSPSACGTVLFEHVGRLRMGAVKWGCAGSFLETRRQAFGLFVPTV